MKLRISILFFALLSAFSVYAQGYNTDRVALANFLVRMYKNAPFEGVRVVEDYECAYLLSALSLDKSKYNDASTMNRVANVKAMAQANRFFNGSRITDDLVIHTTDTPSGTTTEVIETINENSIGYVKALQLLTNFEGNDGRAVFLFITPLL